MPAIWASAALSHASQPMLSHVGPPRVAMLSRTAFAPAYAERPSPPSTDEIDEWITHRAGSRPRIASISSSIPRSLGEIWLAITDRPVSATGPKAAGLTFAAPWITTSIAPNRSHAASTAARTCASSRRSAVSTRTSSRTLCIAASRRRISRSCSSKLGSSARSSHCSGSGNVDRPTSTRRASNAAKSDSPSVMPM